MSDTLKVTKRSETGSLRMKRLRQSGQIPAVLYGHGEGTLAISVATKELDKVIQHGSHIVKLTGAVTENALVKHVQWDAFGSSVLHLDFARISADEEVEVTLPIELKGEAPGTHNGGVVSFQKHEVQIACPANQLPDKIEVSINELELDGLITLGDIEYPPGVKLLDAPEEPVVSCAVPTEVVDEEEEPTAEGAEPEVIGAKEEEGEGDE